MALLQRENEEISLVLLDVVMPGMDGFAVLEEMEKRHWLDTIPGDYDYQQKIPVPR